MTCRVQARGELIDLAARQRIRKLFGPKPTIRDFRIVDQEPDTRPCDTEPPGDVA